MRCEGWRELVMKARLRAVRFVVGVSPVQIARSRPWFFAPDLDHVEAAEAGLVMPNYSLLGFYWRRSKLTSDFFENGELKDIQFEIEGRLFAELRKLSGA